MKKTLLTLVALLSFSVAYSQYYYITYENEGQNPGNLNNDAEFPVGAGLPAGWNTLLSGPKATAEWSANQNLPFAFTFNGQPVTSYRVSSTGVLTFDILSATSAPGVNNAALPSANIPDNSVCIWGIEAKSAGDNIITKTFGSAPNRQFWIQFSSFSEPNLQDNGWAYWSIVLEEGTNKIFVVDQRTQCVQGQTVCTGKTALTVGIQIDGSTAIQIPSSPNVQNLSGNDQTPADNAYYEFTPGIQPANDLAGRSVPVNDYLPLANAPFDLAINVMNLGSQAVTSVELSYSINGNTAVTGTVNGLNIPSGAKQTITHPVKWTPAVEGTYTVEIWASLINGMVDESTANDKTSKSVQVIDQFVVRKALHEVFTSSTCGPCKPGNEQMHRVVDPKDKAKYTVIKYQQDFPGLGDPYCTQEALNRRAYYAINSIPRLELDGGWDQNPIGYTDQLFDNAAAIPSFIELTANHTVKWRTVDVDITIDPLANITGDLRLHVAILEAKTVKNVETNGEKEFVHVMKKMLPNENGTAIGNLVKGSQKTYNLKYDFKGEYRLPENARNSTGTQYIFINNAIEHSVEDFNDLEVIVFVQNHTTKEVFQSTYSDGTILGIEKNKNEVIASTKVYPNPAQNIAKLDVLLSDSKNLNITVIDQLGKEVMALNEGVVEAGIHTFELNVSKLSAGTYFVKINTDDQIKTEKIVVTK